MPAGISLVLSDAEDLVSAFQPCVCLLWKKRLPGHFIVGGSTQEGAGPGICF